MGWYGAIERQGRAAEGENKESRNKEEPEKKLTEENMKAIATVATNYEHMSAIELLL